MTKEIIQNILHMQNILMSSIKYEMKALLILIQQIELAIDCRASIAIKYLICKVYFHVCVATFYDLPYMLILSLHHVLV